ncbi:uncharacterized protein EV422DRAFT_232290 [Fimicolochytrium jonesii]|uniref:uncharacterized protein n=1 Tax=Fimicolochytrium jonesii TaxID=1396493 RepID=UPI0022FE2877|nr:uncharacterized protein EV422DRAFT_232290 [Fimicolochytrium jonesii]KAI8817323.1 hypothetical protein EV422DRAFT_232290 [Fimicolochytrium jonesii]
MINEPLVKVNHGGWVGMEFSAENAAQVARLMRQKLDAYGMTRDISKIVGYAHSHDRPDYPRPLLVQAGGVIDIISWHCYSGDATASIREFPGVQHIMGECTPYTEAQPSLPEYWEEANGVKNLFWNGINDGYSAVIEWNIVLERSDGTSTHFNKRGCHECRGMINTSEETGFASPCVTSFDSDWRHCPRRGLYYESGLPGPIRRDSCRRP